MCGEGGLTRVSLKLITIFPCRRTRCLVNHQLTPYADYANCGRGDCPYLRTLRLLVYLAVIKQKNLYTLDAESCKRYNLNFEKHPSPFGVISYQCTSPFAAERDCFNRHEKHQSYQGRTDRGSLSLLLELYKALGYRITRPYPGTQGSSPIKRDAEVKNVKSKKEFK